MKNSSLSRKDIQNSSQFVLEEVLNRICYMLPAQAPIKDFIHHNTLHAFQEYAFEDAVTKASTFYGAKSHMSLEFYRKAYKDGRITEQALNEVIEQSFPRADSSFVGLFKLALLQYIDIKDSVAFQKISSSRRLDADQIAYFLKQIPKYVTDVQVPNAFLRAKGFKQLQTNWDLEINPILVRITAAYLDQGILLWPFLGADVSFFKAVQNLINNSIFPLAHFVKKKRVKPWFELSPDQVISEILKKIVGNESYYEAYITETLMAHPGWSGMVNVIEHGPVSLRKPRAISLKEFLSFKLILEWELIASKKKPFEPVAVHLHGTFDSEMKTKRTISLTLFYLSLKIPEKEVDLSYSKHISTKKLEKIWQEAFELTYHQEAILSLQAHHANPSKVLNQKVSAQVVFCIDDRECSFRRYLEETDPSIETFGTAGFFGLDFYFQSLNDAFPVKLCPAPVTPYHIVKEVPAEGYHSLFEKQKSASQKKALSWQRWQQASKSISLGFIAANTLGHLSFFWLLASLLRPVSLIRSLLNKKIRVPTDLLLLRREDETKSNPVFEGFTYEEMTDRVFTVLRNMGMVEFSPLIVLISHGSSSLNNPHFAAYDCGACSGRPGAPNARTFAMMANMPEVRQKLASRGMIIPQTTHFIGAYHDTCVETVEMFDLECLSKEKANEILRLQKTIDIARGLNAKERCRRFAVVELGITTEQALNEVNHRASVLFEPRPELNHATNALCVVGRRSCTRGLFLDRRAFLNSYDPNLDSDGAILKQILNAVIPVCGGINLEYYFSRIDPAVYGCGTKLSHNVCSLLGVYNGIDDDLRTGLPVQMTEIHDPVRLLLVIEQKPEIIMQVLQSNRSLMQWVQNEWVKVACIDPGSHKAFCFKPNLGFVLTENGKKFSLPIITRSSVYAMSSRENLQIAQIHDENGTM
jgi:uncharacterized protein